MSSAPTTNAPKLNVETPDLPPLPPLSSSGPDIKVELPDPGTPAKTAPDKKAPEAKSPLKK
jgi:hypothetical protein